MNKVIITAEIEDSKKWEEGFRTHSELFRKQTTKAVHFATTDANEVAICFTVENLDAYLEILNSPATEEAMAFDGVKRETVKVFVLDKELAL